MKIIKFRRLLYVCILLLGGCVSFIPSGTFTAPPAEKADSPEKPPEQTAAPSVTASLPEWTVRNLKHLTARVEFSGGDEGDTAECGIAFFNTLKDPRAVTAAVLVADGDLYPLEEIRVLFVKGETHELHITAEISRESLRAVLEAETLYLVAALDGKEYQFEPDRNFAAYKRQALEKIQ
ncbi:MAG: hypothetical protein LBQ44_01790 [Treponema sp.]|jgi:hypothetical protein|nr:hypothetical protein [Treponema sp.]